MNIGWIRTEAKRLILDQHQNREKRPKPDHEGVVVAVTRFDQGIREGEITAYLNTLLLEQDPEFVPGPGYDHDRESLRTALLREAKTEEQS